MINGRHVLVAWSAADHYIATFTRSCSDIAAILEGSCPGTNFEGFAGCAARGPWRFPLEGQGWGRNRGTMMASVG